MALRRLYLYLALILGGFAVLSGCKQQSASPAVTTQVFPELSPALDQSLDQRLDAFETTFANGEMGDLVDFMPPKILETLLTQSGVSLAEMKKQLDAVWEQTTALVSINNFEITRDQTSVELASSGRPYKILPTQVEMKIHANKTDAVGISETLAFFENGKWYILRLDEVQMVAIFENVYPDLADIEIMKPIMKIDGNIVQP